MATGALITVEEREPELVHGELVDRPMPTFAHAEAQAILVGLFRQLRQNHPVHGVTELRVRLGPELFRIPDVVLYVGARPTEAVPSTPPLVVVEITSPDDRHQDLLQKLTDYRTWGVAHIWVVNPEVKTFEIYTATGLTGTDHFELPQFGFRVSADELFVAL